MTHTIITHSPSLESKVFPEQIDTTVFEKILDTLDHVKPVFVSRKEFQEKKGEFLVQNGKDTFGDFYDLYLPEDIKIYELPAIIKRVNTLTFGENLPEHASTKELQIKICIAIKKLLTFEKTPEVKKALKKYYQLYVQLFPGKENNLNKSEYLNSIIDSGDEEKYKNFEQTLTYIQTKEQINELSEELSAEIGSHFKETFFEKGVNMLRLGMMTITQAEQESLTENNTGSDITKFHIDSDSLDQQEQLLRDKIDIDTYKKLLDFNRKYKHTEHVQRLEKEATNNILSVLYEYPYQLKSTDYGYQPNKILEYKEIYCVGFSLLGHAFLSELGIKHSGLSIPSHSALEINIGDKNYYFDATMNNYILEFNDGKKIGNYIQINGIGWKSTKPLLFQRGNPETILFSQMYNNKGVALSKQGKYDEAIKMYDEAIRLNPSYASAYNNKGVALYEQEKYDEAIKMYDEAIRLDPSNADAYNNKGNTLSAQGKYILRQIYYYIAETLKDNYGFLDLVRDLLGIIHLIQLSKRTKIKEFIKNKDFEGLRLYLLEIEKTQAKSKIKARDE